MSSKSFWRAVAEGLRAQPAPSWQRENLRAPVSTGLMHVPGHPLHKPRRQDDEDPEATP